MIWRAYTRWRERRRDKRRWRRENKDVPLHQLRGTVFYENPAKQRWVKWWLWRREHLWNNPIALAGLAVAVGGPVVGLVAVIAKWLGVF
jgi:hypothetical protein